jgi:hypothetical protein
LEIDNDRAARILAENRHKELVAAIKSLESTINKLGSNETTIINDSPEMKECVKEIRNLMKTLSNQPKPETPVINIQNRNDEIVKSISQIADKISSVQQPIPQEPEPEKEYEFAFKRSLTGLIESPIIVTVR